MIDFLIKPTNEFFINIKGDEKVRRQDSGEFFLKRSISNWSHGDNLLCS